jgi:hypothetical protein
MKFATHIVLFGQDKWIMKNIENSYPHVDRIYIAYSELPWNYNPTARQEYKNSFDLNIIRQSKFNNKIVIIEGDWLSEEDQRNACVNQAKSDKIDYLMIHDADEFYFYDDFEKIKNFILNKPNYDIYTCAWISFWKSFKYITVPQNLNKIVGHPQIFINLNRNIRFEKKRKPNGSNIINIPDVICYHASYVLTDIELKEKLKTWGHHNDFNIDVWYNNIWLKWTPEMLNLHPVNPPVWYKAIGFNEKLPEVLSDGKQ